VKKILKILAWIGGFILGFIVVKEVATVGDVKKKDNWAPVPGHKSKVLVKKNHKRIFVTLPKDPETNKRMKSKDLVAVGISEKGGIKNVKIKKRPNNIDVVDSNSNGVE
jgi:hypothetical protein